MDMGFESISTRPKAKVAKAVRLVRDSGCSSFELVTDPDMASGQETGKEMESVAEDVLGGTTLSSSGGSLTSSSVASGQVPEPKDPPSNPVHLDLAKEKSPTLLLSQIRSFNSWRMSWIRKKSEHRS